MTIRTYMFEIHRKEGHVQRVGKATFIDGRRCMTRTLWYDEEDNCNYVILNGKAFQFKAYSCQDESEIIKGHI